MIGSYSRATVDPFVFLARLPVFMASVYLSMIEFASRTQLFWWETAQQRHQRVDCAPRPQEVPALPKISRLGSVLLSDRDSDLGYRVATS